MIRVNKKAKKFLLLSGSRSRNMCVCARVSVCWSKTVYLPRELYIDRKLLYRLIWKDTEANRNNGTDIRTDVVSPFFRCCSSLRTCCLLLLIPFHHVFYLPCFGFPFSLLHHSPYSCFIYFLCEFPNAAACVLASS